MQAHVEWLEAVANCIEQPGEGFATHSRRQGGWAYNSSALLHCWQLMQLLLSPTKLEECIMVALHASLPHALAQQVQEQQRRQQLQDMQS